jgi:hypothetical protein
MECSSENGSGEDSQQSVPRRLLRLRPVAPHGESDDSASCSDGQPWERAGSWHIYERFMSRLVPFRAIIVPIARISDFY